MKEVLVLWKLQELVQQINNNELSFTRLDKINTNISGVGILSNTKIKFMELLLL